MIKENLMRWDRLDIVEAYYVFFVNYHEGQNSDKYRRLSKISTYYKPSVFLSSRANLTDNGKAIYDQLVGYMMVVPFEREE